MLRFEALPFRDDDEAQYGAVIVTSANALRAIEAQLAGHRLLKLPLFAVGGHTAAAARHAGFNQVSAAKGDAQALRDLVLRKREDEAAEESRHVSVSRRSRSRARSRRRIARARFDGRDPDDLSHGSGVQPAAVTYVTLSPPAGSRRYCTIRAAAPAPSWMRRGPAASKYRHWRCRNAAFQQTSPQSFAMPARARSRRRRLRTKMPCSRH